MKPFWGIGLIAFLILGFGDISHATDQAPPTKTAAPSKVLTDAEVLAQLKAQQTHQEMVHAIAVWENEMSQKDPEFEQKLPFIRDREWGLCSSRSIPNGAWEGVAMEQQAYNEVTERLNAFVAFRSGFRRRTIHFLSDPPGARIEVNGNYVGLTPCAFDVNSNGDGTFTTPTTIVATPVDSGWFFNRLYPQQKVFNGRVNLLNALYNDTPQTAPTPVPETVLFSLKQPAS